MPPVLLVDDDPAMLRLLEVNLQLEGFETLTAQRGEDAVAIARRERPLAIVLDVMLPGMDGHEVFAALRADPATASTPVVFLSGRSDDELPLTGQHVASLGKPFDPADLVALVRRLSGSS
jgi:DNA-binding response OmpR family regulator